jgi:hypothetical protein
MPCLGVLGLNWVGSLYVPTTTRSAPSTVQTEFRPEKFIEGIACLFKQLSQASRTVQAEWLFDLFFLSRSYILATIVKHVSAYPCMEEPQIS